MVDKPDTEILPGWSHIPDVPISVSPFFSWPPNPVRMVRWITARWLALTESVILLAGGDDFLDVVSTISGRNQYICIWVDRTNMDTQHSVISVGCRWITLVLFYEKKTR
ncbi:MAG: hypothetical protein ACJ0GC_10435 [Amylibacter sp.]